METRKQPSRKVREEALEQKNVKHAEKEVRKKESEEKVAKKQKTMKKAKSDDKSESISEINIPKGKADAKTKLIDPPTKENGSKKKIKTAEDVVVRKVKNSKIEAGKLRRSRSAEPSSTSNGTKKKVLKKNYVAPKKPAAVKIRKKAAVEQEEVSTTSGKRENSSETGTEAPPIKKGRGIKKANGLVEDVEMSQEEKPSSENGSSKVEDGSDKETKSPSGKKLLNSVETNYANIDFNIKKKFNFKITTWNVAGLRALVKKNPDYFIQEDADIICMNEIKCGSIKDIPNEYNIEGYYANWNIAKGSGGVGILSKVEPKQIILDLPNSEFSEEKRMITAEFEKFFVISVYVVNSGRGLKTLDKRLEWNKVFDAYVKELDKKKPVIIAGDMNVSHQEIDLANPKTNKKNAGFTQEERDGFTDLISMGFIDTFRYFYPETTGAYTFWSYMNNARTKNVGWRLDYFLVSERFIKHVTDNVIRSTVLGSDHCPIVLFLIL